MSELIDMTEDEYLSSPLVNRLRWKYACGKVGVCSDRLIAADEIDRLRAEVEKLRAENEKLLRRSKMWFKIAQDLGHQDTFLPDMGDSDD